MNARLYNEFLGFWFRCEQAWQQVRTAYHGIIGGLTREDVSNFVLPLPPLAEQRAIAHVLRTVQEAQEATGRDIAALKELKKSLMRHLFTYGPVPVGDVGATDRPPLRETEIGPVPAHWQVVRLGEVCERFQYGYTASAVREPLGPKFLRITDIQEGQVNWTTVPYCECRQEDLEKYKLHVGDIVFARTGSVGKAFLITKLPETAVFASYLIRVKVSKGVSSKYCYFFMQSQIYWQQIASQVHGAVQPNVNATQLKRLPIPLPPLAEQREIARILQAVDAKIAAEEKRQQALAALFKSLLANLMTGKVRVGAVGATGTSPVNPNRGEVP